VHNSQQGSFLASASAVRAGLQRGSLLRGGELDWRRRRCRRGQTNGVGQCAHHCYHGHLHKHSNGHSGGAVIAGTTCLWLCACRCMWRCRRIRHGRAQLLQVLNLPTLMATHQSSGARTQEQTHRPAGAHQYIHVTNDIAAQTHKCNLSHLRVKLVDSRANADAASASGNGHARRNLADARGGHDGDAHSPAMFSRRMSEEINSVKKLLAIIQAAAVGCGGVGVLPVRHCQCVTWQRKSTTTKCTTALDCSLSTRAHAHFGVSPGDGVRGRQRGSGPLNSALEPASGGVQRVLACVHVRVHTNGACKVSQVSSTNLISTCPISGHALDGRKRPCSQNVCTATCHAVRALTLSLDDVRAKCLQLLRVQSSPSVHTFGKNSR
jgi:hypothetical protein